VNIYLGNFGFDLNFLLTLYHKLKETF